MLQITVERVKEILMNATNKPIAVVGDVMLDRYFWGSVSRISPEAPVPVIDVENETIHLGGAANVATNLKTLGMTPILCGVIGDDPKGKIFIQIANDFGIKTDGLFIDVTRPTTIKTRIIGNNQQIARLDHEVRNQISDEAINFIINQLSKLDDLSGIVLEDYNKGVISAILIKAIIDFAKERNIPVYVDPKKDNFFNYKGVTLFKPNRKEASQAMGSNIHSIEDAEKIGNELMHKLECDNLLLTLGAEGMLLFEKSGEISSVPTKARHVADVSGAGDTAIATLSVAISGGANMKEAATMANYAAGFVCEKPGIISISSAELIEVVEELH